MDAERLLGTCRATRFLSQAARANSGFTLQAPAVAKYLAARGTINITRQLFAHP
jgi:hypothetical protein